MMKNDKHAQSMRDSIARVDTFHQQQNARAEGCCACLDKNPIGIPRPVDPYEVDYKSNPDMQRLLALDFGKDRALWTDDFKRDWKIWIWNRHPLLGMIGAHPSHPYSRNERVLVYACLLGAAFFTSTLTTNIVESLCNGQDYSDSEYEDCLDDKIGTNFGFSLLFAILFYPYEILLLSFAKCRCAFISRGLLFKVMECLSGCALCLMSILALFMVILGIVFTTWLYEPAEFLLSFAFIKGLSLVFGVGIEYVRFIMKRQHNIERFVGGKNPKEYLAENVNVLGGGIGIIGADASNTQVVGNMMTVSDAASLEHNGAVGQPAAMPMQTMGGMGGAPAAGGMGMGMGQPTNVGDIQVGGMMC